MDSKIVKSQFENAWSAATFGRTTAQAVVDEMGRLPTRHDVAEAAARRGVDLRDALCIHGIPVGVRARLRVPYYWGGVDSPAFSPATGAVSIRDAYPHCAVAHFGGHLMGDGCRKILQNRGVSTHFIVHWNGELEQVVDPRFAAHHAMGQGARSIGVDFTLDLKRQSEAIKSSQRGDFAKIWGTEFTPHRKHGWWCSVTEQQYITACELGEIFERYYGIPRVWRGGDGHTRLPVVSHTTIHGWTSHAHIDQTGRGKWDGNEFGMIAAERW